MDNRKYKKLTYFTLYLLLKIIVLNLNIFFSFFATKSIKEEEKSQVISCYLVTSN